MDSTRTKATSTILFVCLGGAIGSVLTWLLISSSQESALPVAAADKPLYWVAPMDSNYRRDKPGLSPMGMELVPVYDNKAQSAKEDPGTVSISPEVINKLGVRTSSAQLKRLHNEIVTVGHVRYDEEKLIHIHPRVSGWIEKLFVTATGDPVQKDAPLYSLYSPELVNAQEELILALNTNNQRLIRGTEDRLAALQLPSDFVARLKKDKKILQNVTFYSPQDGVVDNLNIREGFFVEPGTTLFSIGALDQVWIEAEVFERQASLVNIGDKVVMTLDYLPGKKWQGKVEYIYPTLDTKTRTVRIRLSFDNPQRQLKPNMFAQITVHTDSEEKRLLVPKDAVIRTGTQNRVVLAMGEGRFRSIDVTIGRIDKDNIEIIDGLKEGDQVVTSAQFLLDSESSKKSDFMRMFQSDEMPSAVWTSGIVNAVKRDDRVLKILHASIPQWYWPEMSMDFIVQENIDISSIAEGDALRFEIIQTEQNQYRISKIQESDSEHDLNQQKIDHNNMDDSSMDHGK